MSRSRRRGSKDLPEDEPEPVAEASEEQRHTSTARESTLVAATSQHSLLEAAEENEVASHELQPSSQRTLRDRSKDPPKENFEEASLELDPATSSSPPKLSRRRSKDPPEESHEEHPEEHATASASSPHKTRRRRSKDLPDEEEEKSSMPPPLETGAVSSSSHPRYLESSVETTESQLPATTELRQLARISVGKELALGHEVEARIAFVEGDRVYYDIGDRGRVSGNFFIDEEDGIKKFLVTWYRSGLTSTMHAESWRDSLDLVGMLLKEAPEQQDELEVLPGVKLEVDDQEYYSAGDVGLVIDDASIDEEDGIKRFPVAWYRTGLTCRVKTEDWMKQFHLVGDPPAHEAVKMVSTYTRLPSMEDTQDANANATVDSVLSKDAPVDLDVGCTVEATKNLIAGDEVVVKAGTRGRVMSPSPKTANLGWRDVQWERREDGGTRPTGTPHSHVKKVEALPEESLLRAMRNVKTYINLPSMEDTRGATANATSDTVLSEEAQAEFVVGCRVEATQDLIAGDKVVVRVGTRGRVMSPSPMTADMDWRDVKWDTREDGGTRPTGTPLDFVKKIEEQKLPALEDTLRATAAVTTNSEDPDARLALMDMDCMDEAPLQIPDSPNTQAIEDLPLDVQENNEVQALEDLPLDVRENSDVQVPSTGDSQVRRGSLLQRLFQKAKPGAITGVPQQGAQLQEGDNQLEDQEDDEDSVDGVLAVEDPYSSAASPSFPSGGRGYGDDDLSDIESDPGAGRVPVPRLGRFGSKKSTFNLADDEDEFAKMVEINNFNMLCSICASVAWVFGAAGTLLALTLHYVWVEVTQLTETSARAAAEHGCLHSGEVLRSALVLMRTMDLGFRMGSIASIWTNVTSTTNYESTFDYSGYKKVVDPFFKVLPGLREVELVDTPEDPVVGVTPGSIMAARSSSGEVEIRSDRGDCIAVPGRHGCTLESQLANSSSWYEDCRNMYPHYWSANPIQGLWTGPAFSRDLPHEAICDELCWSPTFSLTARISGTVDPRTVGFAGSYSQYRSFVARVTLEATVFVDILRTVQVQSRGEAVICTSDGTVVAAVDMASAQIADAMSGAVGMVKIWDFPRNWSSAIKPAVVDSASGDSIIEGGYLVSAWRLDSPFQPNLTGVMDSLGDKLRLVIAIHQDAFADAMIHSLRFWFIVVSALPVAFVVVMVIVNLYSRFCVPNKMKPQDLTVEEMQRAARRTRLSRASRRTSHAWTMESSMTKSKLGARLTKKMAFMKSRSLGIGQNNRKEMNFNQKPSLPSQFSHAPSSNMQAITNQAR